jgi:hypothetical protein
MPNWTNNSISIQGPKEVLDKFIADGKPNEDGEYSFNSWIPIPETYRKYDTTNHPDGKGLTVGEHVDHFDKDSPIVTEELIEEYKQATKEQAEKYGAVGWYDWRCMYYGCKWDMTFDVMDRTSDTNLCIQVDTPWSAPSEFLLTISERYPELSINAYSVYEEGEWETIEFHDGDYDVVESGLCEWREAYDAENAED